MTIDRNAMQSFIRFITAAAGALMCFAAHAADHPVVREQETQTFTVNRDGSFVEVADLVILVSEPAAVATAAQQAVHYNRANSSLDVLEAYTLKPDGRRLAVAAAGIKDQQDAASINAPQYLDRRFKSIIFPDVAAGDRLVFSTRLTRRTPLFAGEFSDATAPRDPSVGKLALIYDLPADMELHADARGFVASQPAAQAGRRRYRWDYVELAPTRPEADSVSPLDAGARLFVTTFADHAALARAYEDASRTQSTVTPALAEFVAPLIAGLATERDKAVALTELLRSVIRPLTVSINDANAIAPHSAGRVLANRYGDSRDQVVLLRALLDAAGIGNTAALLNQGRAYRLPAVAAISLLNRAIVYVPSLDLYLDPSDRATAAGFLAGSLLDKPTLLTASATIGRTPAGQRHETRIDSDFVIAVDGAGDFHSTTTLDGGHAERERAGIRSIPAGRRPAVVADIMRQRGLSGTGDMDVGDLAGRGNEYRLRYSGRSDDLASLPGPIGINAAGGLVPLMGNAVAALAAEPSRKSDFVCASQGIEERARYLFADGVHIIAVPSPVTLHNAWFDFTSSYERRDNAVWVRRQYRLHHPGRVCSADDFRQMLPSIAIMQRDLDSQLIIQAK